MLLGNDYRNDAVEKLYGDRVGNSSIIFTPWDTVEDMLDLIPEDFWTPDVTILDMYCKSGRFLVGAFRKLYNSPYLAYLSEGERTLHILNKQLFGLCSDMTCMLLAEANLYGYAQYGKKHIKLVDAYDYDSVVKQRKDNIIERTLEGKLGQMKFDLVIGNPPYNNDMYIDFVEIGHKLATQYSCWVTPAKWQGKGGDKNEHFRKEIVPYMEKIVYYPDCTDVFAIGDPGGISYFTVSKIEHKEKVVQNISLKHKCIGKDYIYNDTEKRQLNSILSNIGNKLIHKLGRYKAFNVEKTPKHRQYEAWSANKVSLVSNLPKTYLWSSGGMFNCLGLIDIINTKKGTKQTLGVPNDSRLIYTADTEEECNYFKSWAYTRFVRFLLSLSLCGLTGIATSNEWWRFVPAPEAFDHIFTDQELYEKYNLTKEEINIIESVIKERK